MTASLLGRFGLITGASRGLGLSLAKEARSRDADLLLVSRSQEGLAAAEKEISAVEGRGRVILAPLDIRDEDAVSRLSMMIAEQTTMAEPTMTGDKNETITRTRGLDFLIGNAGILGGLSPIEDYSYAQWNEVLASNLTSNWLLLKYFSPLLRRSDAARIVMISSGAAAKSRAFWAPYSASKAALESLTLSFHNEFSSRGITAMAVRPGAFRSGMRAAAMPGEDPETLPAPEDIARQIIPMLSQSWTMSGKVFDVPTGNFFDLAS